MAPDERKILMELSEPDEAVLAALSKLDGDLLLLGAGGKIGLGLALMAKRGLDQLGASHRVIAVSRFSNAQLPKAFAADGIGTVAADLADPETLARLPDADGVIFLAGNKFGTTEAPSRTWMLNTFMPGLVANRWKQSRLVVFSSGNVYGLTTPASGGPTEAIEPEPVGEYAQTVLGRERIFDHFSRAHGTKMTTIRLNYANEPWAGPVVDPGAADPRRRTDRFDHGPCQSGMAKRLQSRHVAVPGHRRQPSDGHQRRRSDGRRARLGG